MFLMQNLPEFFHQILVVFSTWIFWTGGYLKLERRASFEKSPRMWKKLFNHKVKFVEKCDTIPVEELLTDTEVVIQN